MSESYIDIVAALQGKLNTCQCAASGRSECGCCDCIWPEDAAYIASIEIVQLRTQLATVTAQRDAAVEALKWLRDHPFPMKDCEEPIKLYVSKAIEAAGDTNEGS